MNIRLEVERRTPARLNEQEAIRAACERGAPITVHRSWARIASPDSLAVLLAFVCIWEAPGAERWPQPEPPVLVHREISQSSSPPAGAVVQLTNRATSATLFLPEGWSAASNREVRLVVHFHTIAWFTIQEHLRRRSQLPLLNFALGEGSATYAKPFEDPARFGEWLRVVEAE